jgi:hypothetical protein
MCLQRTDHDVPWTKCSWVIARLNPGDLRVALGQQFQTVLLDRLKMCAAGNSTNVMSCQRQFHREITTNRASSENADLHVVISLRNRRSSRRDRARSFLSSTSWPGMRNYAWIFNTDLSCTTQTADRWCNPVLWRWWRGLTEHSQPDHDDTGRQQGPQPEMWTRQSGQPGAEQKS